MEYLLPRPVTLPPALLFVVDTNIIADELKHLRDTLLLTISLIPESTIVGLITFGKNVHVHDLTFEELPRAHVFAGDKHLSSSVIQQQLDLPVTSTQFTQPMYNVNDKKSEFNSIFISSL